ncbi:MAG: ATP synthase F1 subunit delta [Candidatus Eremiobacteraeota bacterium]|nr:ATP synthase F1 subunit delta [Candidatus Eremiobacteraeota bacterium]
MANETVARRYAAAVFSLAQEQNAVAQVGADLATIGDSILADESTKMFFLAPIVNRQEKEVVLTRAFEGNAHSIALHLLLLLVRKRREALLGEIVEQYAKLEMEHRGAEPLTITSAKELSAQELRSMVQRLEELYKKKFDVTQRVDTRLIGGVRIMMGDRRIDGSVAGRLDELSRNLFAKN